MILCTSSSVNLSNRSSAMRIERVGVALAMLAAVACGDDDGTGVGGGGLSGGTTSTQTPSCSPALVDKVAESCPSSCGTQVKGSTYTFCTVSCMSAESSCPSGTECLQVLGDVFECLPP